jgi:hypothetical protein
MGKEYYVSIDSIDRDRSVWPLSSHFEVKFGALSEFAGASVTRSFKNVSSIELVGCTFPNTANVLDEPCLYLSFDDLPGRYDATNAAGSGAFAKLVPAGVFGGFVQSFGDAGRAGAPQRKLSYAPGVRLDKLTVSLKTTRGTLFDFGSDYAANEAANPALQTSLTLRVVVDEPYVH